MQAQPVYYPYPLPNMSPYFMQPPYQPIPPQPTRITQ
jgi:hypothetical protein